MSDGFRLGDAIESPCINICVIHPGAGLCVGCLRTGDEIARWSGMSHEARRALMEELPGRSEKLREAGALPSRRTGGARGRRGTG